MDSSLNWDAEKMLKRYIYDYLVRRNLHTTALTFRNEVDVPLGPVAINDSVEGFLSEWWQIFCAIYFGMSTSQDPRITCEAMVLRLNERNARKMEQSSSSSTRAAIPILQRPPPLMFVPGVPSGVTNYSSLNAMKDFRSFATQPVDHCLRNINPNLRAPNNIRPPGLATSSTNLIRNFSNVGSKRNAQPANLDSKRPKVNVTPIASQVSQIYRPPKINVPVIGLPHTAPTRFASPFALQNEEIALPNFGLNQFLMPTLQAYIQEQALLQRNSVADNLVRGPQTDSSMEMLAQSNKGKQLVEEKNEGKTKDKSLCIANENIGAMNETGGGLSSFNCTSPENYLDFGSSPFSLSAAEEYFKKNKGMVKSSKSSEDLINENYICFEEEVKGFLFPEEKDEIAGPSSTHESRQGSNEEKDAAEKGSNEEEEVFFLSDEKDEKAGPLSTSDESKQGSNEEKDAATPKGHEDDVV